MTRYYLMLLILLAFKGFSQTSTDDFQLFKDEIHRINSEIDFSDKLIFLSVWKSNDYESREINKEAYRVYKIYEVAKLKNGEKGTIFISVNLDEDPKNREISVSRDNISADVVYSNASLIDLLRIHYNITDSKSTILFDKTGTVQFTNISKDQVFPSLRNLITR